MWKSLAIFIFAIGKVSSEVFTAMTDMENVVHTEKKMLVVVDEYLRLEEERLQTIKDLTADLRRLNEEALEDVDRFLGHPVNAFMLVKRFIWDWVNLENWMKSTVPLGGYMYNTSAFWEEVPSQDDLEGAAKALWRLQDTYDLTPTEIAEGDIKGTRSNASLSAHPCFEIAKLAYHSGDKRRAIPWLKESLERLRNQSWLENYHSMNETQILDHLAFAYFSEGELREAIAVTDELIEREPEMKRYQDNKAYFRYLLDKKERPRGEMGNLKSLNFDEDEDEDEDEEDEQVVESKEVNPIKNKFNALCRGEEGAVKAIRNSTLLRCSYQHYHHPQLLLQPAKEEVAFDSPKIVVFRDMLSILEMGVIKDLAKPRLQRATIWNSSSGSLEYTNFRISKSAWIKQNENDVIQRIYRRVEAYTGLSVNTSEDLQAVNYGIGGHYEPHCDFSKNVDYDVGNRIATLLFYLTDVDAGGDTVFPTAGTRISPEKGSGLFWYNLHRSGDRDYTTKHGACPVLAGSKWVANIWMHEYGQEFRRPCGLTEDEE